MMHIDIPNLPLVANSDRGVIQMWAEVFRVAVVDMAEALCQGRENAAFWLRSPDNHPGSFVWLCGLFGYDCNIVRRLVEERKELIVTAETRGRKPRSGSDD